MTPPEGTVGTRFDWITEQIAGALATQCDPETGFADTEFYGSAFAAMLWQRWPERFNADIKAALDRLKRQDKQARIGVWGNRFHWEFVRFALADLFRSGPVGHYREPGDVLGGMGFVRNRVANWTLLRSTVRLAGTARLDRIIGRMERWLALAIYQRPDGFIEDQRGAPTQQYHAFAAALLGYQISVLEEPSAALHEKFRAALQALVRTALHDGEVNAIGRGRFQSFGYAAAALALAIGLRLGCAPEGSITLLRAIADRLEAALGPGGTLPLMITRIDETEEVTPPPHHPHQRRIGWHSYNNGPDYLAFSGAVLKLAAEQLAASPEPGTPLPLPAEDCLADGIRIVRNAAYSAIVTLPRRTITASQPLPYIVTASGARPLPSYGDEALPDSIYTPLSLPLPVFEEHDGTFRTLLSGTDFRWSGPDKIVGETATFRFERRFRFEAGSIEIEDALTLTGAPDDARLHLPWLTLPASAKPAPKKGEGTTFTLDGASLESDLPLTEVTAAEPQYGISGRLRVWSHATALPPPGDIATARYRVLFTA
ncbi:hypothetical protein [uncultured Nisaea sp.]|uniref:hypothetical protein n=1 Tax=uncultured Nisaea sp. TaxID=538215 RepID=UPI0030EB8500